ncbi:hypothetical protein IU450_34870 [Nocardia abscessus]|nr:hypothetical protein [Nocardia abscessus]MBF6341039.1 hypothetical protein [Nocardia abscessus]
MSGAPDSGKPSTASRLRADVGIAVGMAWAAGARRSSAARRDADAGKDAV